MDSARMTPAGRVGDPDRSAPRQSGNVIPLQRPAPARAPAPAACDAEVQGAVQRMIRLLDRTIELAGLSDDPAAQHHFDTFALEALTILSDVVSGRNPASSRR